MLVWVPLINQGVTNQKIGETLLLTIVESSSTHQEILLRLKERNNFWSYEIFSGLSKKKPF